MLKAKKALDKVTETSLEKLPTVEKVIGHVKVDGDGVTYQLTDIKHYDSGLEYIRHHYV